MLFSWYSLSTTRLLINKLQYLYSSWSRSNFFSFFFLESKNEITDSLINYQQNQDMTVFATQSLKPRVVNTIFKYPLLLSLNTPKN